MCGIIGFISSNKYNNLIGPEEGNKALNYLRRRGPDSLNSTYFQYDSYQVFLGHTRLAIQDTSTLFNQPYKSNFSENLLVYNGEIYNYNQFPEYKDYTSDTKALYDLLTNKKNKLSTFDGIFAFAFWNNEEKKLYLARDRFGVKPLFIYLVDGFLAFSSSLRALVKLINKKLEYNSNYIRESLEFGYCHNNSTTFKKINKLNKNTIYSFNPKEWDFNKKLIYKNNFINKNSNEKISIPSLKSNILETLESQTRTSSRGFGFFLSGGTDSSLLVSEAVKQNLKTTINTYSLEVPGNDTNEIGNIKLFRKLMNKFSNIKYKSKIFDQKEIEFSLNSYPFLDYPVLDISILPSISLCESVDKKIRVILSGDGADELFAGYPRIYSTFWRFLFINLIPQKIKTFLVDKFFKDKRIGEYLSATHPLEVRRILMGADQVNKKFYKPFKPTIKSIFKVIMDYENNFYLPSVLEKVDSASMHSSLEVRVPFLSKKLVDYISKKTISNLILQRSPKFHLKKLLEFNTSHSYAFSSKKGLTFNNKNQNQFIIDFIEKKNYPFLLDKRIENKISKSKIKYIRLLLLKHWIFGFREEINYS